jgi:hypothetical protein
MDPTDSRGDNFLDFYTKGEIFELLYVSGHPD